MPKRARDYDEMRPPRKRRRISRDYFSTPLPDTFMSFTYRPGASFIPVLNRFAARITALPDDVIKILMQYIRRPRMLQAFNSVDLRVHQDGGVFRFWAGTEWMRRRNVVVSKTRPGETGIFFRDPNLTSMIDRVRLGMPTVPTSRGATMRYDNPNPNFVTNPNPNCVPYYRLHTDELFSGSHEGPIDLT